MLSRIDQLLLALRMGAPKQKDQLRLLLTDDLNNAIGKTFPAFLAWEAAIPRSTVIVVLSNNTP
jgi:hypothetical protein